MVQPLGYKHSSETRAKMSASHANFSGINHPMFGKKHTQESLAKMSVAHKGAVCPMKGKKHSLISIEKMRLAKADGKHPQLGTHRSKETKEKIRLARMGHEVSLEVRDKISKTIHERLPEYVPKLIAAWADPEKKAKRILEHNPNWQGGISFEPYCPKFNNEFKERVRSFFGYQCVECGTPQNGIKLCVHHVNFNKQSCCDGTLPLFVPLCTSCHSKTSGNRQYWEDHFTTLIKTYYEGKCYLTQEEQTVVKNVQN